MCNVLNDISAALGTDGGNTGLLPAVSNALGTDGSKNGLLNDPLSLAAAAAAVAVTTGYVDFVSPTVDIAPIAATAATATAATEGALIPLDAVTTAGWGTVANVTAGTAAATTAATVAGTSLLPDWLTAAFALDAAKIAVPAALSLNNSAANLQNAKDLLQLQHDAALKANTGVAKLLSSSNGLNSASGTTNTGSVLPLLIVAAVGVLAYKKYGK